ncbi:hypothetical protein JSY14_06895 [Brachybacterium sp. EF45031]|uniref:hypothetical protein n=1 Tax=Brachybacterium sillae TaxID=2810536 RepID=UPI00217E7177|nr:hypothetical protein [Brachybacterium sillae]MCS6711761.1 hypothetical protein [Brachybacterium sillae]
MQESGQSTPMTVFDGDAAAAQEELRALLADAEAALSEAFTGLDWADTAAPESSAVLGGCTVRVPGRRASTYLGREASDWSRIEEALTSAARKHGMAETSALTGGTGGWLTSTAQGRGLRLEFRSKGHCELAVSAVVAGDCAD